MEMIKTKSCIKCCVEKPITQYAKSQTNSDRLNHKCKSCAKEDSISYQKSNPNCICDVCENHFYKPMSQQKKNTNHFCSKQCYNKYRRTIIEIDLCEGKKNCSMCNERKSFSEFIVDKKQPSGYRTSCKLCSMETRRKSKEKKEKTFTPTITKKKCNHCNETKLVSQFKIQITTKDGYSPECNNCHNEKGKLVRRKRIETNQYIESPITKKCCRCKVLQPKENFYVSVHSPDKLRRTCINCEKELRIMNTDKNNERLNHRRKTNPIVKLKSLLRGRIRKYITRKSIPMNSIIGCDWETLKKHIESQFTKEMNWENNGPKGWHLDHHIPLNSAKNEQEIYELNHYTNLKPLWWKENLSKGYKISEQWGNA
jgi:hypothetical protein